MQEFLIALMECSVTMSAFVLLFFALTPKLSKRYAAKWLYYGWLVIVIGLIIPFRFHPATPLIQGDFNTASVQQMASDNSDIEEQDQFQTGTQNIMTVDPATVSDVKGTESGIMELIQHSPWYLRIGALWIFGVGGFIAIHGIRHRCFLQMVRRWSNEINDKCELDILHNQKAALGISKRVALRACPCVNSPMMIGMINPVILLPAGNYSDSELSLFFRHELVHLKRKDLWYKVLIFIATAIHWFNPVIYLMAKAIAVQCEISCDEEVVKDTGMDQRQLYSQAILRAAKSKTRMQTAFSTNFYGGKKEMKNRIISIMDGAKKKTGILILCAVLLLTMGSGAVFAASADNTENLKTSTEYTVEVYNDTTKLDFTNKPFIQDGELYLPLRETLAAFGIDDIMNNNGEIQIEMPVSYSNICYEHQAWKEPAGTCKITIGSHEVIFPNQEVLSYTVTSATMRTVPIIMNDSTYVPVDFFETLIKLGQIPQFRLRLIQPSDPSAYYSEGEEVFIGTETEQENYNPMDENGNRKLIKRIIVNEEGEAVSIVTVENQKPEVLSELRKIHATATNSEKYYNGGGSTLSCSNAYGERVACTDQRFVYKNGEFIAYIPPAYQINNLSINWKT